MRLREMGEFEREVSGLRNLHMEWGRERSQE